MRTLYKVGMLGLLVAQFSLAATKVTVEGIGYSAETALQNALRHAVDEGVVAMSASNTKAIDTAKLDKEVLSKASKYVKNHMVLETKEEFGLVKVTVAVEIASGDLRQDLEAQKLLYEIQNKPRVMVILDERFENQEMFEKTATHKFEEALIAKGFKVVDPTQLKEVQEKEKLRGLADPDLADLAFRMGADLVIRGGVSAGKPTPKDIYGKTMYTVPVQLNAHIVRADNAEIIASKTKRVKKNSQEEFSAAQFGLEVGGSALAEELLADLMNFWNSENYAAAKAEMIVSGLTDAEVSALEKKLKKINFLKSGRLRYMEKKSALWDLEMTGSVQDLRELLQNDASYGLTVVGLSANRLMAKKGKTEGTKISYTMDGPGLDIAEFSIHEVFPSRVRYYENNPLASVTLKASGDGAIQNIDMQIFIPRIMDAPITTKVGDIQSGEKKEVPVKLLLSSDKLMGFRETQTIQGQVKVSFYQKGKQVTRELSTPVQVYDRNTMDWVEPKSLGTFVTYRDPAVNSFAREALSKVTQEYELNKPIQQAMAIFTALQNIGVKYVKDPSTSPGTRLMDRVQYPRETLQSKTGDCDDTSVLLAALLTAVGIETAVISYPDHVLVMFNTGLYQKNMASLGADSKRVIPHKEKLWVPIETTLIPKGFTEAWTSAAEEFQSAVHDGEKLSVIELDESWKLYAAAPIQGPEIPLALKDLGQKVDEEAKRLIRAITESYGSAIDELVKSENRTPKEDRRLGILYSQAGKYSDAQKVFEKLFKKESNSQNKNNWANSILLQGDEKKAIVMFEEALKGEKLAGLAVNRALAYYLRAQDDKDVDAFVKALKEANALLPAGEKLDTYLGMDLGSAGDGTRASGEHEKAEAQKLNQRRLRELIKQKVLEDKKDQVKEKGAVVQTRVLPYGGIRGADPEQIAQVVDLLYWYP